MAKQADRNIFQDVVRNHFAADSPGAGVAPPRRSWQARVGAAAHQAFDFASFGRIRPLEGARGFSVLLVFLVHYDALFSDFAPHNSLTAQISRFAGAMGNAGVDMFFVISGYLIYGAVIKKSMHIAPFLKRRVQRIYPTFLSVFALYVLGMYLIPGSTKAAWHSPGYLIYVVENLLLLPGILPITPIISVAWSLSFEIFFYVTLPIIVVFFGMREWTRTWRVAFFLSLGLLDLLLSALGVIAHVRLSMFIPGVLLYECSAAGTLDDYLEANGERLAILIGLLGLLAVGWLGLGAGTTGRAGRFSYCVPAFRVIILAISFGSVLLYSFRFDGVVRRWFSWTPICWLGNISYSYYLIHGGALYGFRALDQLLYGVHEPSALRFWLLLPTGFAATIVATVPVFLLVEKRFSLQTHRPS
jgi:exopolysaccharide production protein ExoZ